MRKFWLINVNNLAKAIKFRASKQEYVPSNQLTIESFFNNFHADLDPIIGGWLWPAKSLGMSWSRFTTWGLRIKKLEPKV